MNIRIIRLLSLAIMATAAAVSYGTQRNLFLSWAVDSFTASVAPVAVDMLAIICTLAIHTENVARKGRLVATLVLLVTGTASTAANFVAGETIGSRVVHGAMVVLYLMAEWIAAQVKAAPTEKQERAKCPEGCTCGRHTRKAASEPVKVTATRKTPRRPVTVES